MLAQPPDSYRGPFPPPDPRLPYITQAHESAEESWNRAASTKEMQQQAMMRHAMRNAPLQQIHAERLGLEGGPEGGMEARAPMTLASHYSSAHSQASEAETEGWWLDPEDRVPYVPRNPFHNRTQVGLVQHGGTQTEHQGSRHREPESEEERRSEAGGGGGEQEEGRTMRQAAAAGWRHMRPLADFGGAAVGALGIGTGYLGGAMGSALYHGSRGAINLVGQFMQPGEREEAEQPHPAAPPPPPPPDPLLPPAVPPKSG